MRSSCHQIVERMDLFVIVSPDKDEGSAENVGHECHDMKRNRTGSFRNESNGRNFQVVLGRCVIKMKR